MDDDTFKHVCDGFLADNISMMMDILENHGVLRADIDESVIADMLLAEQIPKQLTNICSTSINRWKRTQDDLPPLPLDVLREKISDSMSKFNQLLKVDVIPPLLNQHQFSAYLGIATMTPESDHPDSLYDFFQNKHDHDPDCKCHNIREQLATTSDGIEHAAYLSRGNELYVMIKDFVAADLTPDKKLKRYIYFEIVRDYEKKTNMYECCIIFPDSSDSTENQLKSLPWYKHFQWKKLDKFNALANYLEYSRVVRPKESFRDSEGEPCYRFRGVRLTC